MGASLPRRSLESTVGGERLHGGRPPWLRRSSRTGLNLDMKRSQSIKLNIGGVEKGVASSSQSAEPVLAVFGPGAASRFSLASLPGPRLCGIRRLPLCPFLHFPQWKGAPREGPPVDIFNLPRRVCPPSSSITRPCHVASEFPRASSRSSYPEPG